MACRIHSYSSNSALFLLVWFHIYLKFFFEWCLVDLSFVCCKLVYRYVFAIRKISTSISAGTPSVYSASCPKIRPETMNFLYGCKVRKVYYPYWRKRSCVCACLLRNRWLHSLCSHNLNILHVGFSSQRKSLNSLTERLQAFSDETIMHDIVASTLRTEKFVWWSLDIQDYFIIFAMHIQTFL